MRIIEVISACEDLLEFLELELHVLNRTALLPADRNLTQVSLGKRVFIERLSGYLSPLKEESLSKYLFGGSCLRKLKQKKPTKNSSSSFWGCFFNRGSIVERTVEIQLVWGP